MHELINAAVVGQELALAFGDGVECYLPLEALRSACPCAACQGEPDVTGRVIRPRKQIGARGFELSKIETIGGYALQLFWADGHSTGIYSFDYLRRLAAAQSS
ncbi:gamma-butyrobetaine hydroxylase-like domain-containing protein [Haloferula sp.]|uniref:gamma-butyrobetaine hydroxylase-like domain-containing protein n=1 Tax=Haloferula sp. TaxID=2497595 RepID=UPI003C71D371